MLDAIVVAVDLCDAERYAAKHLDGQTWRACTAQSPDRVRGFSATKVHVTDDARTHRTYERMVQASLPCVAAASETREADHG